MASSFLTLLPLLSFEYPKILAAAPAFEVSVCLNKLCLSIVVSE